MTCHIIISPLNQGANGESKNKQLKALVMSHISNASIISEAGTELALRLPREEVSKFASLFKILETQKDELGMTTFGVETTTLEEVFLRIMYVHV